MKSTGQEPTGDRTRPARTRSRRTSVWQAAPTRLAGLSVLVERSQDGSQLGLLTERIFKITWEQRCRHLLVCGKPGSGKTTTVMLPLIFSDIEDPDRTVVVLDAQASEVRRIIEHTLKVRGPRARIVYFNPQDRGYSVRWNPFAEVKTRSEAVALADSIASSLPQVAGSTDGGFFRYYAARALAAMILGLRKVTNGNPTGSLLRQCVEGGTSMIQELAKAAPLPLLKTVADNLANGNRNDETMLSELSNMVSPWNDESVELTTSVTEFAFAILDAEPTVLIYAMPEESVDRLRPLTNAFLTQFFKYVTEQSRRNGGTLRRPHSLILDEFASAIGQITSMPMRANTLRKRGLSITAAVQSLAQIREVYGPSAGSLLAAFNHLILIPPVAWEDAVYASEQTGLTTVQTFTTNSTGGVLHCAPSRRLVLTADEIANPPVIPALPGPRMTFLLAGMRPFQGWLRPVYRDPRYRELMREVFHARLPLPPRRRQPKAEVIPLFETVSKAYRKTWPTLLSGQQPPGITETLGWSDTQVRAKIEEVRQRPSLDWAKAPDDARKRLADFEIAHQQHPSLVLRLFEEINRRQVSLAFFHELYLESGISNVAGVLHYVDYALIRREEQQAPSEARAEVETGAKTDPEPDDDEDSAIDDIELLLMDGMEPN